MDLMDLSEEDALILWRHGGYGTRADFPGARIATLRMLRSANSRGRRNLARLFASLAPRVGVRAIAALLRVLTIRPAGIRLPAPAPRDLSSQRRCHRLTPARAP